MVLSVPEPGAVEPFAVLIVEDDPATARLLRHLLGRSGYEVQVATTVTEARAEVARREWDLFILDRRLPDGNGLDLARELKGNFKGSSRYILMLTADGSEAEKVEAFDGGADDYVTKPFSIPEVMARVRAGLRIVELQKALIAGNRRLEEISTTDNLTGVRNRRWFDDEFRKAFEHARRYSRPLSLAIIDVDYFKRINDLHGHLAGDAVLQKIATSLSGLLRKSDALARIGGEEFAVILPESALFDGLQFGEKVREAIAQAHLTCAGVGTPVTISVGIASLPHSQFSSTEQMLSFADKALYRAKNRGRNRVEVERRAEPWRKTFPVPEQRDAAVG